MGCPLPRIFFPFLSWYAAFWVQSDAFSDTTRPVYQIAYTHNLHRAQISLSLPVPNWVRDAEHFKGFFTGGEKRLKGQDVRVKGGIAFGRDSETAGPGIRIGGRSQYNRPTFCFICCRSTTILAGAKF